MKVIMRKALFILLFIALLCFMAACAEPRILVPASSALIVDNRAVKFVKGVNVEVTGEGWPGNPGVYGEVTPLKITVKNINGPPLRIGYALFSLIGEVNIPLKLKK